MGSTTNPLDDFLTSLKSMALNARDEFKADAQAIALFIDTEIAPLATQALTDPALAGVLGYRVRAAIRKANLHALTSAEDVWVSAITGGIHLATTLLAGV